MESSTCNHINGRRSNDDLIRTSLSTKMIFFRRLSPPVNSVEYANLTASLGMHSVSGELGKA